MRRAFLLLLVIGFCRIAGAADDELTVTQLLALEGKPLFDAADAALEVLLAGAQLDTEHGGIFFGAQSPILRELVGYETSCSRGASGRNAAVPFSGVAYGVKSWPRCRRVQNAASSRAVFSRSSSASSSLGVCM